jgi:hypothetical protein
MRIRNFSAGWLALIVTLLVLPQPCWAWTGKVVGIADGDTITVLHETRPEKIRLYGIDCPEKRQAFGKNAKWFTSKMAFGKTVDVEPINRDRYGRTVALEGDVSSPRSNVPSQRLATSGPHDLGRRTLDPGLTNGVMNGSACN